ncbi:ribosomal protein S18-alanine N-acetyltransferase [Desulforhopalus sp. IMCC35007]|uniref:ribosomal protein S18-alanine N-acetyltransferase n=1 Tax=Desulforhopalus sp. IMCC35007 TaxID=2569543 RepID=UPI00145DEA01|nr:ribosomal protein S18-alanine N-acetyltransferase [Desulforhopalus sp. IMCC35007]
MVERIEQQTFSPWSQSSLIEELHQDRGVVFVAEEAADLCISGIDRILGWCACRFCVPEAELLKIAVHTRARRQGLAIHLLKHLEQFLVSKGVDTLFLEVRSQNQSALNLYVKSGFLQVGKRSGYYSNPEDNALIYRKKIAGNV